MGDGKLQWHTAFQATFQIELEDELDKIKIEAEHLLGKKPMQIDLLVVKKEPGQRIVKNIGRIFRTYNIIEYKSPDDYLSINDFYKVYGYACFYQSDTERVLEINPQELTITFVTNHHPGKLLHHLQHCRGITAVHRGSGIYELTGDPIPMQLIVVRELSKEQNYWLQVLRNDLQSGGEIRELLDRYEDKKNNGTYQAVMDVLTRANSDRIKEEKDMCEALKELFAEDFAEDIRQARILGKKEGREVGFQDGIQTGIQQGIQRGILRGKQEGLQAVARNLADMGMAIEDIAKAVAMQVTTVQEWLRQA